MSQLKSSLYLIEFKDGRKDIMNVWMLDALVDKSFTDISRIVKKYKLQDGAKKSYYMTLFSEDHNISANDFIEHYRSLPKDKYGSNILEDFDVEIINMFN
jgi:hypothetical protein